METAPFQRVGEGRSEFERSSEVLYGGSTGFQAEIGIAAPDLKQHQIILTEMSLGYRFVIILDCSLREVRHCKAVEKR
jgi:hypothetical protein